MLHYIRRALLTKTPKKQDKTFSLIMARAHMLKSRENTAGLRDLMRLLLRPIQTRHIVDAYTQQDHGSIAEISWTFDLGIVDIPLPINSRDNDLLSYCMAKVKNEETVEPHKFNLACDIVLPTTWHPTSLINNLGRIRADDSETVFRQDSNHKVSILYPLEIGWVEGGNHSIAQAIIAGKGFVHTDQYIDISELFDVIEFNGRNWVSLIDGHYCGTPRYREFGWAWEITRLIIALRNHEHTS